MFLRTLAVVSICVLALVAPAYNAKRLKTAEIWKKGKPKVQNRRTTSAAPKQKEPRTTMTTVTREPRKTGWATGWKRTSGITYKVSTANPLVASRAINVDELPNLFNSDLHLKNNPELPSLPYTPYQLSNITSADADWSMTVGDLYRTLFNDTSAGDLVVIDAGNGNLGHWEVRSGMHPAKGFMPLQIAQGKLFELPRMHYYDGERRIRRIPRISFMTLEQFATGRDLSKIGALRLNPGLSMRFAASPTRMEKPWRRNASCTRGNLILLKGAHIEDYMTKKDVLKLPRSTSDMVDGPLAIDLTIDRQGNCQECEKIGISKLAVRFCAERFGCDGVLSSGKRENVCGVCGGKNACMSSDTTETTTTAKTETVEPTSTVIQSTRNVDKTTVVTVGGEETTYTESDMPTTSTTVDTSTLQDTTTTSTTDVPTSETIPTTVKRVVEETFTTFASSQLTTRSLTDQETTATLSASDTTATETTDITTTDASSTHGPTSSANEKKRTKTTSVISSSVDQYTSLEPVSTDSVVTAETNSVTDSSTIATEETTTTTLAHSAAPTTVESTIPSETTTNDVITTLDPRSSLATESPVTPSHIVSTDDITTVAVAVDDDTTTSTVSPTSTTLTSLRSTTIADDITHAITDEITTEMDTSVTPSIPSSTDLTTSANVTLTSFTSDIATTAQNDITTTTPQTVTERPSSPHTFTTETPFDISTDVTADSDDDGVLNPIDLEEGEATSSTNKDTTSNPKFTSLGTTQPHTTASQQMEKETTTTAAATPDIITTTEVFLSSQPVVSTGGSQASASTQTHTDDKTTVSQQVVILERSSVKDKKTATTTVTETVKQMSTAESGKDTTDSGTSNSVSDSGKQVVDASSTTILVDFVVDATNKQTIKDYTIYPKRKTETSPKSSTTTGETSTFVEIDKTTTVAKAIATTTSEKNSDTTEAVTCANTPLRCGCDGVIDSGYQHDSCGRCLPKSSRYFDTGCRVVIDAVIPPLIAVSQTRPRQRQLFVQLLGAMESEAESPEEITLCDLVIPDSANSTFALRTLNVTRDETFPNIITGFWVITNASEPLTEGIYDIDCHLDSSIKQPLIKNDAVYVVDLKKSVEIASVSHEYFNIEGDQTTIKVMFTALGRDFVQVPYCVVTATKDQKLPLKYHGALTADGGIICDFSSVTEPGVMEVFVIPRAEYEIDIMKTQRPVAIIALPKRVTVKAMRFSGNLAFLVVFFNENVRGPSDCEQIFSEESLKSIGVAVAAECRFAANKLYVRLGDGATISPSDTLKLQLLRVSSTLVSKTSLIDHLKLNDTRIQSLNPPTPLTKTVDIPVKMVQPSICVVGEKTLRSCDQNLALKVSKIRGSGRRPMRYRWSVSKASDDKLKSEFIAALEKETGPAIKIRLQTTLISPNVTYTISTQACNFVGGCSEIIETPVVWLQSRTSFTVSISGVEPPLLPRNRMKLYARPEFRSCDGPTDPMENVDFSWIVSDEVISTKSSVRFPAFHFQPKDKKIILIKAKYTDPLTNLSYEAKEVTNLVIGSEPLRILSDGSRKVVGSKQDIRINCAHSYDPNSLRGGLKHSWSCALMDSNSTDAGGTVCYARSTSGGDVPFSQAVITTGGQLHIPADTLPAGIYHFSNTMTSESGRLSRKTRIEVEILEARLATITIAALETDKPNVDDYLRFTGTVSATLDTSITWAFAGGKSGYGYYNLETYFGAAVNNTFPARSFEFGRMAVRASFTLPPDNTPKYPNWPGLSTDTNYTMVLRARTVDGTSSAELNFRTNAPPLVGEVDVTPQENLQSITTEITVSVGSGWSDDPADYPLTYQYGLRTLLSVTPFHEDEWFAPTSVDRIRIYLATAWKTMPACEHRTGYQPLLRVCDRHGACSENASAPVLYLTKTMVGNALQKFQQLIDIDVERGDSFGAYQKTQALKDEECMSNSSSVLSERIATGVLTEVSNDSDADEIRSGLDQTVQLLSGGGADSNDTVDKLLHAALLLRQKMGMRVDLLRRPERRRKKRAVSAGIVPMTVSEAETLLGAFEVVVRSGRHLDSYLNLIHEIMAGFCISLDSSRGPLAVYNTVNGGATALSRVQSQVIEMHSEIHQQPIVITGLNSIETVLVSTGMRDRFYEWTCENGQSKCRGVCVASAQLISVPDTPLRHQFNTFGTQPKVNMTQLRSEIYLLHVVDQIAGSFLTLQHGEKYTLKIPLKSFVVHEYYKCYHANAGAWNGTRCTSSVVSGGATPALHCTCKKTGYVAVFASPPPPAPAFPAKLALRISVELTTAVGANASLVDTFDSATDGEFFDSILDKLSKAAGVDRMRLVDPTFDPVAERFQFVFRPISRSWHLDYSTAVGFLNRTVSYAPEPGYQLGTSPIDGGSILTKRFTFTATPIERHLSLDGYARRVSFRVAEVYEKVLGEGADTSQFSTSTVATSDQTIASKASLIKRRWTEEICAAIGLPKSRMDTMSFSRGSVDVSLVVSKARKVISGPEPKSAEEAALILDEKIRYKELVLTDENGVLMKIQDNSSKVYTIVDTPVDASTNYLAIIVAGFVCVVFFLVAMAALVLVIIKHQNQLDRITPSPDRWNLTSPSKSSSNTQTSTLRRISITEVKNTSGTNSKIRGKRPK